MRHQACLIGVDTLSPEPIMSSVVPQLQRAMRRLAASRAWRFAAPVCVRRIGLALTLLLTMATVRNRPVAAQDVSVSPSNSPIARPANTSNQTVTFGISNLTSSSIAFVLHCTATGFVTGCSSPTRVTVPGFGFTQVTVTFSTGASGTGTLQENASDPNGGSTGEYTVSQALANVAVTPDTTNVQSPSTTVVNDNEPCAKYNKSFAASLNRIDAAKIPYHAYFGAQNSNSVVFTLLLDAGIRPPNRAGDVDLGRDAPGWGVQLIIP